MTLTQLVNLFSKNITEYFIWPVFVVSLNLFFSVLSEIFRSGFPNSLIVRSRSSFLFSQAKFFELYVRTCTAVFFSIRFTF